MKPILHIRMALVIIITISLSRSEVEGAYSGVYRCHINLTGVDPLDLLRCPYPGYCRAVKIDGVEDELGVCRCDHSTNGCPVFQQIGDRCEADTPDVMFKCENREFQSDCWVQTHLGHTWGVCKCLPGYRQRDGQWYGKFNVRRDRSCVPIQGHACHSVLSVLLFIMASLGIFYSTNILYR